MHQCDGTRPRCAPCTEKGVLCEFIGPEGADSRDIARHQLVKYKSVIEVLHQGSPAEAVQALHRIREADNIEDTVSSIVEASYPPPASSSSATSRDAPRRSPALKSRLLKSPYEDSDVIFDKSYMVNARDQYVTDDVFIDVFARNLPLSRWTTVSTDNRHMNHLLTMFFTWDNVVERVCYRPILEEDVVAMDSRSADHHRGTFCSRILINALLAVSCLYTLDPVTFQDPQDSKSRGRRWADEAEAHLESIDRPSIPLL
ncbi:hypothetical protein BFJ69_g16424 [Fusarium oxysporum]|uniref:Zn(2)-C6 fungal-type domain-containing protein n=1 Tax=Fusarium oxysporum TaxID=5507 RepID=A0A420MB93_FUSOX|nr:hypothetical protein BFJ69_g16424 [Fusarium oxysporum]